MASNKKQSVNDIGQSERAWFDHTAADWENQYAAPGLRGRQVQKRMSVSLEYLKDEELPSTARILVLGCGPGIVAERIASYGFRTYAVDFSSDLLARTQNRLKHTGCENAYIVQADAHRLPFKKNAFDAIVCIAVITWVADPAKVLREIARVLRPGGTVIITVRNRCCIKNVFDPLFWVWQLIPDTVRAWVHGFIRRSKGERQEGLIPEAKQFWIHDFDKMLRNAGLVKIRWRTIQYGPFRLFTFPIFPIRARVAIDRGFERIWWVPVIRRLGWTYCVKAAKSLKIRNTN